MRGSMVSAKAVDERALLRVLLRESPSEALILDPESLLIVQANPAALKNLRYRLKDARALSPLQFLTADDVPAFRALLNQLRSGPRHRARIKARCQRSDGTRYPVEARVVYEKDATRPFFLCMTDDLSEREATRAALAHSASDLQAIVAHIPGMAFQIVRSEGEAPSLRYVSEQSRQLLGIRASALRLDPDAFFALILEEDRPGYLEALAASEGGHLSFNWEGRIWLKAWKDVKWVEIRVSERRLPGCTLWDGIMLNITRSKEAEVELARSRARLRALAAHVETAKEQERLHLAREVHDDLGGNLTTIKIGLSCLARQLPAAQTALTERVHYLDKLVDQTFDAAHRIASNLRPAALDFGIVAAIDSQLQSFGRNTDIETEFTAPKDDFPLDPAAAIALYRIVQEGLTNIAKHARATRVRLELVREHDALRLALTDNGRGLPAARNGHGRPAFGILGMSERAAALGGDLVVRPASGRGTELSLRIPLSVPAGLAE